MSKNINNLPFIACNKTTIMITGLLSIGFLTILSLESSYLIRNKPVKIL